MPNDVVSEGASVEELVELGAVDSIFYSHAFFPATVRQESPRFHREIWNLLEGADRLVNIEVFRGGAKTTILRLATSKRIAYSLSRTILYVGKSQDHAKRSVRWIKMQVMRNKLWATTFGLRKGEKWNDEEINIINEADGTSIWVLALGITGSVRGVNFDDYRPDYIIVDDVVDEENAATPEQRLKIENLVLGSIKESMAPRSESPLAKMAILQTPLDFDDISQKAKADPQFRSARFGCWTPETERLPLELKESIWPARWTSEELRQERTAAIIRNKLSLFAREMECTLIAPEDADFRPDWMQYYGTEQEEPLPPLHEMWVEMAIDPVPPPSELQIKKGLYKKDFESFAVVGRHHTRYYLLDISYNRGHDPSWTVMEFFRLLNRWNPRKVLVEAVAYQRTLAWLLREAMKTQGRYVFIQEVDSKVSKRDRILDALHGVCSNRQFFCHRDHGEFISQFTHYPTVQHDDVIDAVSVATMSLLRPGYFGGGGQTVEDEDNIPALEYERGAP